MLTTDIKVWYLLFHDIAGDENEYVGGSYLCKLVIPDNFPADPPQFYMLTPNGLYGCDGKVCVSIGEFHANSYPATIGVTGFAEALVSGLIGWKSMSAGTRLLTTTIEEKKRLATASVAYNAANYSEIMALF